MQRIVAAAIAVLVMIVAGCGGSNGSGNSVTGGVALGQPSTYGDPPAASTMSLDGLQDIVKLCTAEGGTLLNWTDPSGEARDACMTNPAGASKTHPLPLLVYLNPSLVSADLSVPLTGLLVDASSADLTGDTARPGFILLTPSGRDTTHYYPFPDNEGIGWDNWYRNLDRSSPALNVDVATIDHFITAVTAMGIVDPKRVYLTGWSNGAAMAQLYALNTPDIAAAAVYSSPAPFSDVDDPGAQTPFATALTPLMDIHNQCDIIGTCQTSQQFHQNLAMLFPKLIQQPVIIDELFNPVQSCSDLCASQSVVSPSAPGALNHLRWPLPLNAQIYAFLRDHPLP